MQLLNLLLETGVSLDLTVFYDLVLVTKRYNLVLSESKDDILRLEISMNDLADAVQVVESYKTLPCDLASQVDGNTFKLIFFNDIQQVHSKDLEDEAEVFTIRASIDEGV